MYGLDITCDGYCGGPTPWNEPDVKDFYGYSVCDSKKEINRFNSEIEAIEYAKHYSDAEKVYYFYGVDGVVTDYEIIWEKI